MSDQARVFTGYIKGKKLHVRGWKALDLRDGEVLVTVERAHATRSHAQNAWYWGQVLRLIADHTGYTVDEVHEYCKQRFNAKRVAFCDDDGTIHDEARIGVSTTKLNRVTFGEYCEAIREWAAADLGVVIPDPDPAWRQNQTEAA